MLTDQQIRQENAANTANEEYLIQKHKFPKYRVGMRKSVGAGILARHYKMMGVQPNDILIRAVCDGRKNLDDLHRNIIRRRYRLELQASL